MPLRPYLGDREQRTHLQALVSLCSKICPAWQETLTFPGWMCTGKTVVLRASHASVSTGRSQDRPEGRHSQGAPGWSRGESTLGKSQQQQLKEMLKPRGPDAHKAFWGRAGGAYLSLAESRGPKRAEEQVHCSLKKRKHQEAWRGISCASLLPTWMKTQKASSWPFRCYKTGKDNKQTEWVNLSSKDFDRLERWVTTSQIKFNKEKRLLGWVPWLDESPGGMNICSKKIMKRECFISNSFSWRAG